MCPEKGDAVGPIGTLECSLQTFKVVNVSGNELASMQKYVKKYGWDKFREIESDIMEKLSNLDDCIFDISGDIVMRNENMISLKRDSIVILLTADLRTIENRLKSKNLTDSYDYADEMRDFFQERETKYKKSADYTIDTSSLSPGEVCELVMHYMQLELQ